MICAVQAWGSLTAPKWPQTQTPHCDKREDKAELWPKNTSDERQRIRADPVVFWWSFPSKQFLHFSPSSTIQPQQLNSTGIFACWGFAGVTLTTDKACSVMKLSHVKWIEQRALIWANYSQPLENHGCGKVRQWFPLENRKLMPYITSFLLDPTAQGSFLFYCDTI